LLLSADPSFFHKLDRPARISTRLPLRFLRLLRPSGPRLGGHSPGMFAWDGLLLDGWRPIA